MEGNLSCSVPGCPSTFSSTSTLRRHIRIVHNGSRTAECPTCHKTFRDNYTLRIHSKVHADPEYDVTAALECPVCGKTFSVRAAYSNHVKIHKKWNVKPQDVPKLAPPKAESSSESEGTPASIKCFVCEEDMECGKFLGHVQEHVKGLIKACNDTAETLGKCEVSLEQADEALNSG